MCVRGEDVVMDASPRLCGHGEGLFQSEDARIGTRKVGTAEMRLVDEMKGMS